MKNRGYKPNWTTCSGENGTTLPTEEEEEITEELTPIFTGNY